MLKHLLHDFLITTFSRQLLFYISLIHYNSHFIQFSLSLLIILIFLNFSQVIYSLMTIIMYLKVTSFKSGGHTLGSALGHYGTTIKNEQENELSHVLKDWLQTFLDGVIMLTQIKASSPVQAVLGKFSKKVINY